MKVLDLFAGAGGFSLGFKQAGCDVVGAIEIDKWASETYSYNHVGTNILTGDISLYEESTIQDFFEKPDVILGGPPCQGFSICNKNSGDPLDPRNSLFMEMVRFGNIFSPSCIVLENVPNLLKAKNKSGEMIINIIVEEFKKIGYNVNYDILDATNFGVPQIRKRLFIICTKKNIKNVFPNPTHNTTDKNNFLKTPTLWDAISDLPSIEAREGSEEMDYTMSPTNIFQETIRNNSKKVYNHKAMMHGKRTVERFASMGWGDTISDVPAHLLPYKRNGNGEISTKVYDQNNRRMHPDSPCHTIPASFYANFVHPYKNRNFTAREGARLQTFPDYYVFKGKPTVVSNKLLEKEGRVNEKYLCQYNQIGNAVPPMLAQAIAEKLKREL